MADLATNVTVGQADHPGLHNEERAAINALRATVASLPTSTTSASSTGAVDASAAPYNMSTTASGAANGAALQAAIIAANGRRVTAAAGDYIVSGANITDQHVNIDMPGVYWLQETTSDTCLTIERTPAAPISVGATYLTWWGPYQPSGVAVSGLLQVIPATGLSRFKGGRVYHICSRDIYPWAWSALNLYNVGDTPVYTQTDGLVNQAEQFPLLGIGVVVSSTANGGPREQMMVQGATSGAQGLVTSVLTGNANGGITATQAHLTFTSVTADFVDGENLVRSTGGSPIGSGTIATVGQTVGVVTGAPVLLTTDIFTLQYGRTATAASGTNTPVRTDNTVQLREVDTKPICRMNVNFDVSGGREAPDAYNTTRPGAISMRGVYAPEVKWRVRNAWTRALQVWSSYMGRFDGFIDQMPNHAALDQSAFGYGLELKSGSKANLITLMGHTVRHLFTTNPNQRTYSATNNYDSGKWTQWDYGTPVRNTVDGFVVECAFGPGIDSHPGDYYTTYRNGRIYGGGSGGRYNTDNNSAYSSRGFGSKWENVEADASVVGFNLGGVEHDAGINHRYSLTNVRVAGALAQAVFCPSAMVPGQAIIEVDGGAYSCRTSYPKDAVGTTEPSTSKYGVQTLFQIGSGVSLELSGEPKLRKFGAAAITMRGSGDLTIWSAAVDATECPTSACVVRMDIGTSVTNAAKIYELKVSGSPTAVLRNISGNSAWLLGDIQWLGTGTQPPLTLISAGSPTFTQIAPMTNAGGGATHSTATAPTVAAGAGLGTTPSGISLNQTQLTSTDVYGEVQFGTDPSAVSAAGAVLFTVTFGTPFATLPKVRLTPGNPLTAGRGLMYTQMDSTSVDVTLTGFSVRCAQNMATAQAAANYKVIYQVDGI